MYKLGLIILFLFFVVPHGTVMAASGTSVVTPLLYSIAQEQAYVDSAIGATSAANLSPQQLLDIIFRAQAAGTLPSIGTATASGNIYKASTGISGTAVSQMPGGTYTIGVTPVDGVTMTIPSRTITLDPATPNVLDIAMKLTTGSGRVVYRSEVITWDRVKTFVKQAVTATVSWDQVKTFVKQVWAPQKKVTSTAPVGDAVIVIRLYQDANNNGAFDEKEKIVPWANATIFLTPISK